MQARPSWDEHYIGMAEQIAKMGTCARRQVGCVLVDARNRVVSTGFNGVPPGWPHCSTEVVSRCPGAEAKSGTRLDECNANHAEANALIYCPNPELIRTCYVTCSPCINCVKMLLVTGCSRIVFKEEYPQKESKELWTKHDKRMLWKKLE